MSKVLLDPTGERTVTTRTRVDRPGSIQGQTIGLLDISKPRGNIFLDRLEERLVEAGATVVRYAKPTFTKPAPVDLRHEIATQCTMVIEALADRGSCTSCSVHDIVDLESRGLPGVFVASAEFVVAAEAQSASLGFPTVARVFTPHPIQDRTDDEMRAYADDAYEGIVAEITRTG
jgi:hypothetical protein